MGRTSYKTKLNLTDIEQYREQGLIIWKDFCNKREVRTTLVKEHRDLKSRMIEKTKEITKTSQEMETLDLEYRKVMEKALKLPEMKQ